MSNTPFTGAEAKELCNCQGSGTGAGASGTVNIYNGEFLHAMKPVILPASRGFAFEFEMTHRSRSPHATALNETYGPNWDYAYGSWFRNLGQRIELHPGDGRMLTYNEDGLNSNTFAAPRGEYNYLAKINDTAYHLIDRYGNSKTYTQETQVWLKDEVADPCPYSCHFGQETSIYRLTQITDNKGNSMRIWPGRAALDTHNRLIYFDETGIYQYLGLHLNDTQNRIFDSAGNLQYTVKFNWTTARWNVWDHGWGNPANALRLGHGYDPWFGNQNECTRPVPVRYDPMPSHREFRWQYNQSAWTQRFVDGWDGTDCVDGWNDGLNENGEPDGAPGWLGWDFIGRDINGNDDDDPNVPQDATYPTTPPNEDNDEPTLDNWPNCEGASWNCIPDLNFNWTLELRTLATFNYDVDGRMTSVDLPEERGHAFSYDSSDRVLQVFDGKGQEYINNTYDVHGRISKQHYGYGDYLFGYDTIDRITRVTDRNGNIVDYYYESPQRPLTWFKVVWTNRDVNPMDPPVFTTRYGYNLNNELTSIRHPRGNREQYIYDDTNGLYLSQGNLLCHIQDPGPYAVSRDGEPQYPLITRWTYETRFNQVTSKQDARAEYPGFLPPNGGEATPERYTTHYFYEHQEAVDLVDYNLDGVLSANDVPNLVRVVHPTVNPEGVPHEAFTPQYAQQVREETWRHNPYGQPIQHIDTMGMKETWEYFHHEQWSGVWANHSTDITPWFGNPADIGQVYRPGPGDPDDWTFVYDPDLEMSVFFGRGEIIEERIESRGATAMVQDAFFDPHDHEGFLKKHMKDVDNVPLVTEYQRDLDGNPTEIKNGNGDAYTLKFGSGCLLNKVTTPEGDETTIERDENGQATQVSRPVGTEGDHAIEESEYDILGHIVKKVQDTERPADAPPTTEDQTPVTYYCYDLNENLILERRPESANLHQYWDLTSTIYDERDNPYSVTRGDILDAYWDQPVSPAGDGCPKVCPPDWQGLPSDAETYRRCKACLGHDPSDSCFFQGETHGPVSSTTLKAFDGNGNLAAEQDGRGHVTRFEFDGYDRQVARIDALGGRSETKHDPVGNVIEESFCGYATPNGILSPLDVGPVFPTLASIYSCLNTPLPTGTQLYTISRSQHDEANRKYRSDQLYQDLYNGFTLQDGPASPNDAYATSLTEYDAAGKVTQSINDNLHASTTTYDTLGRVSVTKDAVGNTVTKTYDAVGNLQDETKVHKISPTTWLTPPESFTTSQQTDSMGRVESRTNAAGGTTQYEHDAMGKRAAVESPEGNVVRHMHDGLGRLLQDSYDRSWHEWNNYTTPESYVTSSEPAQEDLAGPLFKVTVGGQAIMFEDGVTVIEDPVGTWTITGDEHHEVHTWHPNFLNVTYDYDADGRLVQMRDGLDQRTNYTYDALSRKIREDFADGSYIILGYDANDNVVATVDSNGNAITSSYDALNRLVHVNATLGPGIVGTQEQRFLYDAQGRRVIQWDFDPSDAQFGVSRIERTYSSLGNVLSETQDGLLIVDRLVQTPLGRTVLSQYDGVGNRVQLTYPNGRMLSMEYDELERLLRISDRTFPHGLDSTLEGTEGNEVFEDKWLANYSYMGPSHRDSRLLANGVNETRQYDSGDWLEELKHTHVDTLDLVVGFQYDYDDDGRKVEERKLHAPDQNEYYEMDELGRLVNFTRGDYVTTTSGTTFTPSPIGLQYRNWTLDNANNWKQYETVNQGPEKTSTRTHNVANELESETTGTSSLAWAYDGNGNLRTNGTHDFKWDFKNRLREIRDNSTGKPIAKYWYDAENRRIRTQDYAQGTLVDFFLDGMREIQEMASCTGIVLKQYVHGPILDEVIARDTPLPQGWQDFSARCETSAGPGIVPVHCPSTLNPPPVLSLSGSCGPCYYAVTQFISTGARTAAFADCTPCLEEASDSLGNMDPPGTLPCAPCSLAGLSTLFALPAAHSLQIDSTCAPCGPDVRAFTLAGDSPEAQAVALLEADCFPCSKDPTSLLVEADSSGNPQVTNSSSLDTKRCSFDHEKRIYYHQNEQQSVFAVTNVTGFVLEGYAYDPYGKAYVFKPGSNGDVDFGGDDVIGPADEDTLSVWMYTGRRYDAESGLLYFRTRYLDGQMGRFISRDTIGMWADPITLGNSFAYGPNSPQNGVDPSGTFWGIIVVAIIVFVIIVVVVDEEAIYENAMHVFKGDWDKITDYGNFCGKGNHQSAPPLDGVDLACETHDQCIDGEEGRWEYATSVNPHNYDCNGKFMDSLNKEECKGGKSQDGRVWSVADCRGFVPLAYAAFKSGRLVADIVRNSPCEDNPRHLNCDGMHPKRGRDA